MSSTPDPSPLWKGWRARGEHPASDWVDLTHPIGPELPTGPRIERRTGRPDTPFQMSDIHMLTHAGTHMDAPNHFIDGAPGIDQVPLDHLWGPGVVWPVHAQADGAIDVDAFDDPALDLRDHDILIVSTGAARYVTEQRYMDHPHLTEAAAQWMVDRKVKVAAFDFLAPDLQAAKRPEGFSFPVHMTLLGAGTLIVENVADVSGLEGRRIEAVVLPLPLRDADGAPVRMLARSVLE